MRVTLWLGDHVETFDAETVQVQAIHGFVVEAEDYLLTITERTQDEAEKADER